MSINNILSIPIFICPDDDEFEDEDTKNYLSSIADSLLELSKNNVQTKLNLDLASKNISEISIGFKNIASRIDMRQEVIKTLKNNACEKDKELKLMQKESNLFKKDFYLQIKDKVSRVTDVIYMISRHCDTQTLLSISCLNKYFNKLCNEHIWTHVPKSSIEEYAKDLFQNDLCRYTGYVDYLKGGNWTDLIKITLKLGCIALPIFSFIKSALHFGNIPADAPKILVEYLDEDNVSRFREEYDHPEYFLYSKFASLGLLSSFLPLGLLFEIAHFYLDENGTRNKFLNRLQQVDNETRENIQDISLITHYVSPDFFEWKISKINDNKQKIQNFILKLENKRSQN